MNVSHLSFFLSLILLVICSFSELIWRVTSGEGCVCCFSSFLCLQSLFISGEKLGLKFFILPFGMNRFEALVIVLVKYLVAASMDLWFEILKFVSSCSMNSVKFSQFALLKFVKVLGALYLSLLVVIVIMIGKWSEERSDFVVHSVLVARSGLQIVRSGDVVLSPGLYGCLVCFRGLLRIILFCRLSAIILPLGSCGW